MRRRGKFNKGKWEVERERSRVEDRRPRPPPRDATPVGEIIPQLMKKLGVESEHWQEVLSGSWEKLAGKAVAKHTRPGRFEKGTLVVFVDSSVWLNELSRYGKDDLLANLQKTFGADRIKAVRFQLDPDPAP
jgi:predicted nucleic acid-binding Zn ribbon protein